MGLAVETFDERVLALKALKTTALTAAKMCIDPAKGGPAVGIEKNDTICYPQK